MKAELRRLDADYSCQMRLPILALAGGGAEAVKLAYQEYASRYPSVRASDFKGINSEYLSGVGIQINLLGGRVQIEIKVDQITAQIRNLSSFDQIKFAQDVAIIAHGVAQKIQSDSDVGEATLNIRTWSWLEEGKALVDRLYKNTDTQDQKFSANEHLKGVIVKYPPHFEIANPEAGWRLGVQMDHSALPGADLFVMRSYTFLEDGKCRSLDDRLSVVDITVTALETWLGLEG